MTVGSMRAGVRPRLSVNFSARDLVSYLSGDVLNGATDWPSGDRIAHLLTSGRGALYVLLKSLNLPPGSRVGVPLFVCEAVSEAVAHAGHRPVFLDVDPATMVVSPLSVADGPQLDALVAVHLFGNPVDVDSISGGGRLPVIEDCAHAIFSEFRGVQVGTRGAGAIYSFGLGKPISIGRLGAAVVSERANSDELTGIVRQMSGESASDIAYQAFRSFMISALYRPPWYGTFSYRLGRTFEESIDPMSHKTAEFRVSRGRLLSLIRSKIRDYRLRLRVQQEAWQTLSDILADWSAIGLEPQEIQKGGISDRWLFAIRCRSLAQRDGLAAALLGVGIDSIKMYDRVPLIARSRYGYRGGASVAEELCHTVLALPVASPDGTSDATWLAPRLIESMKGVR